MTWYWESHLETRIAHSCTGKRQRPGTIFTHKKKYLNNYYYKSPSVYKLLLGSQHTLTLAGLGKYLHQAFDLRNAALSLWCYKLIYTIIYLLLYECTLLLSLMHIIPYKFMYVWDCGTFDQGFTPFYWLVKSLGLLIIHVYYLFVILMGCIAQRNTIIYCK